MYRHIPFAEDYDLYFRLENKGIKLNNLNKNLIFYKLNEKNIKNSRRAFYLFLSTLLRFIVFKYSNLKIFSILFTFRYPESL